MTTDLFDPEGEDKRSEAALASLPVYKDVIRALPSATGNLRLMGVHARGGYVQRDALLPAALLVPEAFETLCDLVIQHRGIWAIEWVSRFIYAVPLDVLPVFSVAWNNRLPARYPW